MVGPIAKHDLVAAERIAAAAAESLERQLVVPALFQREGLSNYQGTPNDTINVRVRGLLPWRVYGWRNDRSQPIQFDAYSERTLAIPFGGDIYSAIRVTDEQALMDFSGYVDLITDQTEAVGRGLENKAVSYVENAPYEVVLGGTVAGRDLRATLLRAREVMNRFHAPAAGRVLLVGSAWEMAILSDEKLNLAHNVGDNIAESALRTATIGQLFGFTIVSSPELAPETAIVLTAGAFVFATGAPLVPNSVEFGATGSARGVAVRWIRDYDPMFLTDRSVVNTYQGFRHVEDPILWTDEDDQTMQTQGEHFVRAIKLDLGATADVLPAAGSDLAIATKVHASGAPAGAPAKAGK